MGNTGTNTIQPELLLRIEEKRELLFSMPPLPEDESQKLHEEQKLLHTYHSNAIAGNTLTLAETRAVLTDGEIIEGRSSQEHHDAMNTATAFERMETLARKGAAIDHATVQAIHAVVVGAEPGDAGKYRRTNIRAASAAKAHPNWTEVMKLTNQLLVTVRNSRLHPIETAAYFYHGFGDIHPFTEGNGRVGRLCTCLYFMERTYPPVVLKKESRKRYTQLVKAADAGDIGPFSDYLAKAVDENLTLSLAAYGGEDELMSLEDITEDSSYSPEYLRHRAEQGVLDAVQMEHTWYTSRRALERYLAEYENEEW